jgi:hypothetical protein
MFALHGLTQSAADFIFEFCDEAGFVILPAMEPACVLLTREDRNPHLPPAICEGADVIVVHDGFELAAALDGGLSAWQSYRDAIKRKLLDGLNSGPPIPYTEEMLHEKKAALIRNHQKKGPSDKEPRAR